MLYVYVLIFMVTGCRALDVPAKIQDAVKRFYADHHLPTSAISFRQDESYFHAKPTVTAHAQPASCAISLSPSLQKRVLKTLGQQQPFDPEDQRTFLHEYSHLVQDLSNELLKMHLHKIPFVIDTAYEDEAAADFFSLRVMKPPILHQYLQEVNDMYSVYQKAIRTIAGAKKNLLVRVFCWNDIKAFEKDLMDIQNMFGFDDGKHLSPQKRHYIALMVYKAQGDLVERGILRGLSPEEIRYSWPMEPTIRRIA